MLNVNQIKNLLATMSDNLPSNITKIHEYFGNIDYKDEDNQSLLHIFCDNKYDETQCFLAIKSLLQIAKLSPNLIDDFSYNFIQTALYTGYSEQFILNIIDEGLKRGLNVNHTDSDQDTIMHTAIYSDDYLGNIEQIYELLCANGFNSSQKNYYGKNLVEAMIHQQQSLHQYSDFQILRFKKIFDNNLNNQPSTKTISNNSNTTTLSPNEINELEQFGKVLNTKNYPTSPTIGREQELKNLLITLAQNKKNPLIVGASGTGKTALVDELVYRIKTNQVPKFIQNKIIYEVNPSAVVAGCQYVGLFEENMTKLMQLCEKYDVILFIDEIHTIYGIGSSSKKDNDMASMLKYYLDRSNLKVIGTTTDKEYNDFFANNSLKRRFEKISIQEPTKEVLFQIIAKVIDDYSINTGIFLENEHLKSQIIGIILEFTSQNHRVYNDIINNPDLSISIIDKTFAFAKVYDSQFLTLEHFIESFATCSRIYDYAKKEAITKLKKLNPNISKPLGRILKVDFTKP